MNRILLITGLIIGALFLAFLVFGLSVMGDRLCSIYIQNGGQEPLTIKTFRIYQREKTLDVDSIVLKKDEKLEIGACISCAVPDTMDIIFDAIGIYDHEGLIKPMKKTELIQYLETTEKEDCVTYVIK